MIVTRTAADAERAAVRRQAVLRAELTERARKELCGACSAMLTVANSPDGPALRCGEHGYVTETKARNEPSLIERYRRNLDISAAGFTGIDAQMLQKVLMRRIQEAEGAGKQPDAMTVFLHDRLEAEMNGQTTAVAIPQRREMAQFTNDEIEIIRTQICPGASDAEISFLLATSARRKLDPFKKQIHGVMRTRRVNINGRWEAQKYMVIQTGIDGFRLIASRNHDHAGTDDPTFGPMVGDPRCTSGRRPEWASCTGYKLVGGMRVPFKATVYWEERVQTYMDRSTNPPKELYTEAWASQPRGQLAKCSETLMLRRGWPEEFEDIEFDEERGETVYQEIAAVKVVGIEGADRATGEYEPDPAPADDVNQIRDGDFEEIPDAPQGEPGEPSGDARITDEILTALKGKATAKRWSTADLNGDIKAHYHVDRLADLTIAQAMDLDDHLQMDGRPRKD